MHACYDRVAPPPTKPFFNPESTLQNYLAKAPKNGNENIVSRNMHTSVVNKMKEEGVLLLTPLPFLNCKGEGGEWVRPIPLLSPFFRRFFKDYYFHWKSTIGTMGRFFWDV